MRSTLFFVNRLRTTELVQPRVEPARQSGEQSAVISMESQLVQQIVAGDERAKQSFVDQYGRLIHHVLRSQHVPLDDQDDMYQQVFVHLWQDGCKRLKLWRGTGRLSSFISVVTARIAQDEMRSKYRTHVLGGQLEVAVDPQASSDSDPANLFRREYNLDIITGALRKMSSNDAEIIVHRHVHGLSYKEIGQCLNMTPNHVGVALFRAERRLRASVATEIDI